MKFTAAPLLRGDIRDGFSEVPTVAVKILSVVLALAIRLIFRLGQYLGPILPRALAVALGAVFRSEPLRKNTDIQFWMHCIYPQACSARPTHILAAHS